MMEAKPILIIRLPFTENKDYSSLSKMLERDKSLRDQYHVMGVIDNRVESVQFEGVYPKDFDIVSFEQLKEKLKSEISGIL